MSGLSGLASVVAEGVEDRLHGRTREQNPYSPSEAPDPHRAWSSGWRLADSNVAPEPEPGTWTSQPWSQFRDEAQDELRFLVAGIWPEAALGFIAAPPKRGKTWVALAAGLAVATGRPLFGEYDVAVARPVLYIALEGARAGLRARIGCLARGMDLDPDGAELDRFHVLYRPRPFNLAEPALAELVVAEARRIDAAIVFVDVLRQAARGLKEASAEDFARIRDALEPLGAEGRSVALVHHFGKLTDTQKERSPGERMAGSGALEGALDVAFYITKSEGGARRIRLEFEAKDFATPDPIGVSIVGTGSGEHGGFTYLDRAEFISDPSAAEDRDLAAELEQLFEDGEWRTLDECRKAISANKDEVRDALAAGAERFVAVEGPRVGRHANARPWGTVRMLREVEAAEPPGLAQGAEPDEPDERVRDRQTSSGTCGSPTGRPHRATRSRNPGESDPAAEPDEPDSPNGHLLDEAERLLERHADIAEGRS